MTLNQTSLLRAYPQTPPVVHQRMDQTLADIRRQAAAQRPPRRYAVRLHLATVLIVLLLLLTAIGVAAGLRLGVFDFMTRIFGQADVLPQADELVQPNLTALELPHTVLTMQEAVYDGGNLRLVYSVRVKAADAPLTQAELEDEAGPFRQALVADHVSAWGCDWFYLDGVEYTMTNGSTNVTLPGTENGEALCYMEIYLVSSGIAPEQDFSVSLPLVRLGGGQYQTLDFSLKASGTPAAPTVKHVKHAAVTVLSASLSPVRAYVSLRIEWEPGLTQSQADLLLADWQDAVLTDAQGNALTPLSELQTDINQADRQAEYSFTFLPTECAEVWLAPTILTEDDQWLVDMSQAIQIK